MSGAIGARASIALSEGALRGGGTAINVTAIVFTLYIYFTNENRSVRADFL